MNLNKKGRMVRGGDLRIDLAHVEKLIRGALASAFLS